MKIIINSVVLIGVVVVLCFSTNSGVNGNEVEDLREQVTQLVKSVEDLTQRVEKLESGGGGGGGGDDDDDSGDVDESNVVVLTGANFDEETKKTKITLVEFYAPWCGHCKNLKPIYAKAATALADNEDVTLAKMDCTAEENKAVCQRFSVQGFPTLKLVSRDTDAIVDYEDERSESAIKRFMEKALLPALSVIESSEDLSAFTASEAAHVVVVGYVDSDESQEALLKLAEKLRGAYAFGAVRNAELYQSHKAGTFVVHRSFTDEPAVTSLDTKADTFEEELTKFIKDNELPLLGELTMDNYRQYYERGLNFVWTFVNFDDADHTKLLKDAVEPVAAENRGLSFVKMDGKRWGEHATNLGADGIPAIIIEDRQSGRNFVYDKKEVTHDGVKKFVDDFNAGELTAHMKSEEPPADNDGPVKVVVGKTFEDIVMDESKDVMIEFYAPWCGHCKSLAPIYEEVGTQFKGDDGVIVAKVDATANDTPDKIEGFPTIKFYPAGSGAKAMDYEGGRTKEAIVDFINKNRATKPQQDGKQEL